MIRALDRILAIILLILLTAMIAFAQTPPPGGTPPATPFDAMTGILIAAGAGYGLSRLKANRQK